MRRYKYYDEDYEILKYAYDVLSEEMGDCFLDLSTYEDKSYSPFIFLIYDCNLYLPKTLFLDGRYIADNNFKICDVIDGKKSVNIYVNRKRFILLDVFEYIKNNVDDIVGELEFVNNINPYIMFYTKSKLSDTVMKYLDDASCIFFYGGDFNKHKNAYFYLIKIHKKGLYLYEDDNCKQ